MNTEATWEIGWNFILFSLGATKSSIQTKAHFWFIKCKFVITVRLVTALSWRIEGIKTRSSLDSSGNSFFSTSCISMLWQVGKGLQKIKWRGSDSKPFWLVWMGHMRVVTERKSAVPLKREETILPYVKLIVAVWEWEGEYSRCSTYWPQTSDEEGDSTIPGWSFQEQEAQMNFHTKCFPPGPKSCWI